MFITIMQERKKNLLLLICFISLCSIMITGCHPESPSPFSASAINDLSTFQVADGFKVELIASEPLVHVIDEAAIPVLWQGAQGGRARLLAGTAGPDMIELWQWEMQPGERFTSPGHPAGTFELLHVNEGVLTLTVDETVTQA